MTKAMREKQVHPGEQVLAVIPVLLVPLVPVVN